ncbi:MAG: HAMP domain-containing histidine kinase [Oscillospiraceae bacterium]|nr:HAMP domain-containing histidine kinase [Oscillospiraceae bacterium]
MKLLGEFIRTFLIFFCLVAFVVTCCFMLFLNDLEMTRAYLDEAAKATFLNVLILSVLFSAGDIYRRKKTVEGPVREIQEALDKITAGDFTVRLEPGRMQGGFGQVKESINRMTEELGGVETLRTDFIANVSHEMKTPLAVMQNYGTMLQQPGLSEEKRLEYARAVIQGSRRLTDLMTNILKLNRLENQQIYPRTEEFDLSEQLCGCLLQFESRWEEGGIDIDTDIAEEVIIRQDPELLELVWNNLLSNAFKFTEPGGTVGLTLSADETFATVSVSDTGCGMTPEVGAHIFEKFYQGDTSHATAGNGLGLPLVKRIIDITGGEITVHSAPGQGSTFTVRLRR